MKVKVAQSSLTLCNPMDYTVHGILQARILEWVNFSLSRGTSQPRSPALQVDSLPAEPQGKPKNTEIGSLSLLQRIFPTQELNWDLLYCKQILYQLSYQESHLLCQYLTTLCSPCCEEAQARKAEEAVEERCPIILPLDHSSQPRWSGEWVKRSLDDPGTNHHLWW